MCVKKHRASNMADQLVDNDNGRVVFPSCHQLAADNLYNTTPTQCHIAQISCMGNNSPRRQKHKKYRVTFEV